MTEFFLDTNILMRYLTGDDEQKSQRALALLMRVERGEERLITSPLVIFEVIFTLQKFYKVPRQRIKDLVLPIIALKGLHLPEKNVYYKAFELYVTKNISFADAFNAAYVICEQIPVIYSLDTDFDKIEGVVRKEPDSE